MQVEYKPLPPLKHYESHGKRRKGAGKTKEVKHWRAELISEPPKHHAQTQEKARRVRQLAKQEAS